MAIGGNGTRRERLILKWIAGFGVIVITIGLTLLNTTGAWKASGQNLWYTTAVGGAEILVAVVFGLAVIATTQLRKWVGIAIFGVLVWACIENGKFAIKQSFSEIFVDDAESLRQKAELAELRAADVAGGAVQREADERQDRQAVRDEIAALKAERIVMQAQTPQGIMEAQTMLKAGGKYFGPIDGIRADLTEAAMLARGEEIGQRLAVLQQRIEQPLSGASADIEDDPATNLKIQAIRFRAQADEVEYREVWMHIILIAFEGARSFGVWAFLMTSTSKNSPALYAKEEDEPEMPESEASEDDRGEPEPDPDKPMTREEVGKKGADAKQAYKDAEDALVIEIGPTLTIDAQQEAAA